MKLGVDVGGTNTDAVLVRGGNVVEAVKRPTTGNPKDGIISAIQQLLGTVENSTNNIDLIALGTTHFTNAFVQRSHLEPVGVMRLGLPAARGLPPMIDWPDNAAEVVKGDIALIRGGHEYDGSPIVPLDELAVRDAAKRFRSLGLRAVAITGIFAPVNREGEVRAREIVLDEMPEANVTVSSDLGRIGLIERENAAIMNASLSQLARKTIAAFESAFKDLEIRAPIYLSQNDGTLMSLERAVRYPILTFSSGPTNSIRGASFLTGIQHAVVVDIGGTTTDIGVLENGFPRESSFTADIGSIRTNFRMPDVLSLGLGGGSIVNCTHGGRPGPRSVGFRLREEGIVFGGDIITATDIAVAAGYASIGDRERVKNLDKAMVENVVVQMHRMVEEGVERMKTDDQAVPVILVGGGSVLIERELQGVSEVHRPNHAATANAVGASITMVGSEIDRVVEARADEMDAIVEKLSDEARLLAIEAGGDPESIAISDIDVVPVPYIPGSFARVCIKARGDLLLHRNIE